MTRPIPSTREPALAALLSQLRTAVSTREDALFTKFLPKGYESTTLSSVPENHFEAVLFAKIRIGTLITIYDDLADNPKTRDPETLQALYEIPFARGHLQPNGGPLTDLVLRLWDEVLAAIRELPNHDFLRDALEFDVRQFYSANRYGELVSRNPWLANRRENRAHAPHNMGILIVGMIDLMASPNLEHSELGRIRAFLHLAQEISRLMNVMATLDREFSEGDLTGEILAGMIEAGRMQPEQLRGPRSRTLEEELRLEAGLLAIEQERLFTELHARASAIRTFDGHRYIRGLRILQGLHDSMKQEI